MTKIFGNARGAALSVLAFTYVSCSAADAAALLSYSQNFDSMGTSTRAIFNAGVLNRQGRIDGLDGRWWAGRIGGVSSSVLYAAADDGSSIFGGIRNVGVTGGSDRSLGSLADSSTSAAFGIQIFNISGSTATSVTISFLAEQWRSSTVSQRRLLFAYGFGATAPGSSSISSSNFLSSSAMTRNANGDVVGAAPVLTNGPLSSPTSNLVTITLSNVNWQVGQELFIRWQDLDDVGYGATLAIDNFTLTAVPAPGAAALICAAGLLGRRRRA